MTGAECATCALALASTWDDFRKKVLSEYEAFRKAGGEVFVGFMIPHTRRDSKNHIFVCCRAEYSMIISVEPQATSLHIYYGKLEVSSLFFPWAAAESVLPSAGLDSSIEPKWSNPGEIPAVLLAVEIAISRLINLGVDAVNAGFVEADWVRDLH
jgi:hypothetical protein